VLDVAKAMAKLRSSSLEEVAQRPTRNALELFGIESGEKASMGVPMS
jgi:Tat protein secretion system quality control protein TatD with DNase activity